jgi:hypothetical protein
VRNRVEGGGEVSLEHLRGAPGEVDADLLHGLVGVLLRADTGGARREVRLDEGLQHQERGGLDHPVPDRRDAEGPRAPPALGAGDPPDGVGAVGVGPEFLGPTREERGDPACLYGGDRDAVHAGGAPVHPHQGPGVMQDIRPGDLVVAEVEPDGGLRLGLAGARPLESPHPIGRCQPHGTPPGDSP